MADASRWKQGRIKLLLCKQQHRHFFLLKSTDIYPICNYQFNSFYYLNKLFYIKISTFFPLANLSLIFKGVSPKHLLQKT